MRRGKIRAGREEMSIGGAVPIGIVRIGLYSSFAHESRGKGRT
jgi:hypothetical protein